MTAAQPFKSYVDAALARELAARIAGVYRAFPADDFVARVAARVGPLELKARVAVVAEELRRALPPEYPDALAILLAILGPEIGDEGGMFTDGYWLMPVAYFVEAYGLDHYGPSLDALRDITKRHTAEFAIRPFLSRYPERTLVLLQTWVGDPSRHVRRLVSEGTRPRLPWATQLPTFIADPTPVLALLEQLRDDPAAYVRKSVANNLNDIANDHPQRVLDLAARWYAGGSAGTRWVVRHALRTLIKRGDAGALALLGYATGAPLTLVAFTVQPMSVASGEPLLLSLALRNDGDAACEALIDYRIHFVKARGDARPAVFKWATRTVAPGETARLQKTHRLRPTTTRTIRPGHHAAEVQVNGRLLGRAAFDVTG